MTTTTPKRIYHRGQSGTMLVHMFQFHVLSRNSDINSSLIFNVNVRSVVSHMESSSELSHWRVNKGWRIGLNKHRLDSLLCVLGSFFFFISRKRSKKTVNELSSVSRQSSTLKCITSDSWMLNGKRRNKILKIFHSFDCRREGVFSFLKSSGIEKETMNFLTSNTEKCPSGSEWNSLESDVIFSCNRNWMHFPATWVLCRSSGAGDEM